MRLTLTLSLFLLALGCERRNPAARPDPLPASEAGLDAAAPPPPPPVVPRGCDINLGGSYRLEARPSVKYRLEDDGTHVTLRLASTADAGGEATAFTATRTHQGFLGLVTAQATSPGGRLCAVSFRAEIVSCRAEGLTIRSDDTATLDDTCQARGVGAATDKVLLRD